jgi:hypothetical protein
MFIFGNSTDRYRYCQWVQEIQINWYNLFSKAVLWSRKGTAGRNRNVLQFFCFWKTARYCLDLEPEPEQIITVPQHCSNEAIFHKMCDILKSCVSTVIEYLTCCLSVQKNVRQVVSET